MTSLNRIELFLNIDTTNMRLYDGLKKRNKNQFYWFRLQYLIVKLTQDKWCIISCNERCVDILNDNVFCYRKGYMCSSNGSFHAMIMKPPNGLVVDHINTKSFDNRLENLRVVTQKVNTQNKTKPKNNTSGNMGVSRRKMNGCEYWLTRIVDNNNKNLQKLFSISKLGNEHAKQQAILQRNIWKEQFNYLGE